jgi:hypothetical protein
MVPFIWHGENNQTAMIVQCKLGPAGPLVLSRIKNGGGDGKKIESSVN